MSRILRKLFDMKKVGFITAQIVGSIFCITLGILSLGVFSVAVLYLTKAVDIRQGESLIHLFDS